MDSDVQILLAVHRQRARHLDVGAVEVLEFLLPILILELEEESAERGRLIQTDARRVGLDVSRIDLRPGLGRLQFSATWPAEAHLREPAWPATLAIFGERLARQLALVGIQASVPVLVELLDELATLAKRALAEPGPEEVLGLDLLPPLTTPFLPHAHHHHPAH